MKTNTARKAIRAALRARRALREVEELIRRDNGDEWMRQHVVDSGKNLNVAIRRLVTIPTNGFLILNEHERSEILGIGLIGESS